MYTFGKVSNDRLNTCHPDLQLILREAIKISSVDFGVSDGYRSIELQQKYFKEGKSKIDGIKVKGKHNYMPSLAADIYPFINGAVKWDAEHITFLAGIIHAVAEMLYQQGRISHKIRWGGNWDMDGEILLDQSFDDRPHFELIRA